MADAWRKRQPPIFMALVRQYGGEPLRLARRLDNADFAEQAGLPYKPKRVRESYSQYGMNTLDEHSDLL